jgi:hypothetical protein
MASKVITLTKGEALRVLDLIYLVELAIRRREVLDREVLVWARQLGEALGQRLKAIM